MEQEVDPFDVSSQTEITSKRLPVATQAAGESQPVSFEELSTEDKVLAITIAWKGYCKSPNIWLVSGLVSGALLVLGHAIKTTVQFSGPRYLIWQGLEYTGEPRYYDAPSLQAVFLLWFVFVLLAVLAIMVRRSLNAHNAKLAMLQQTGASYVQSVYDQIRNEGIAAAEELCLKTIARGDVLWHSMDIHEIPNTSQQDRADTQFIPPILLLPQNAVFGMFAMTAKSMVVVPASAVSDTAGLESLPSIQHLVLTLMRGVLDLATSGRSGLSLFAVGSASHQFLLAGETTRSILQLSKDRSNSSTLPAAASEIFFSEMRSADYAGAGDDVGTLVIATRDGRKLSIVSRPETHRLLMEKLRESKQTVSTQEPAEKMPDDDTKVCPMCAETVKKAAKICRFCQHHFE